MKLFFDLLVYKELSIVLKTMLLFFVYLWYNKYKYMMKNKRY